MATIILVQEAYTTPPLPFVLSLGCTPLMNFSSSVPTPQFKSTPYDSYFFPVNSYFFPTISYQNLLLFIRPSSDGMYYGMVMSVRVSVRPSVRLSVRPVSVCPFSALFSYMLWHIELKFCTWFCFDVLQIKFDCRHFASIFEGVMPLSELRIKVMCSFPHFSPTCFDILSSNFAYDFVSPYYRSSSSAVNLR